MEMDITILTQLVGSLGFPIVVAGYLLHTMNKTIKENTEMLRNLVDVVTLLKRGCKDE